MKDEFVSLFETGKGKGAVVATAQGLCRVLLPGDDAELLQQVRSGEATASPLSDRAAQMLTRYFKGEPQPFDTLDLDYRVGGGFRRAILESIRSIPFGEVRSYARIAADAGSPRAARAVGGAMAANPLPIIIPCHRVVAANGAMTGYSAPGGITMKHFLLRLEGIEFTHEKVKFSTPVINR